VELIFNLWLILNTVTLSEHILTNVQAVNKEQTPWPLVRERTIPTELPPLVDEIYCQLLWIEGYRMVKAADPPRSLISVF
jgi:hypothetical protein